MNKIAMLVPLIIAAITACSADASQQNNASGQNQGQTTPARSTGQGCANGQAILPDGSCADAPGTCTDHTGPCNTALAAHTLSGCFAANYKAPITLSDGQTYQLAVDTGSSNMAVASSTCQTCNVTPEYTPGASATNDNANVTSGYADGSGWSGPTYTDTIHVDDAVGDVKMAFTAISKQLQVSNTSNVFFGVSQWRWHQRRQHQTRHPGDGGRWSDHRARPGLHGCDEANQSAPQRLQRAVL